MVVDIPSVWMIHSQQEYPRHWKIHKFLYMDFPVKLKFQRGGYSSIWNIHTMNKHGGLTMHTLMFRAWN